MRLIARKTIVNFYTVHATAKGSLEAFAEELNDYGLEVHRFKDE